MKVLRVIPGLDATFGGPSESSVNACIASHRAGVDSTVVVPLMPGDPNAGRQALIRLKSEDIRVVSLPLLRIAGHKAYRWGISTKLTQWLRGTVSDFDIIHVHCAWSYPSFVVLALSNCPPRVLTPHETLTDFDVGRSGTPGMRVLKRLLRPLFIARTERIVFSSELERETSMPVDATAVDSSDVIYHPVVDERNPPPLRSQELDGSEARTLGFIGRFDPKKNLELALQALARLPANYRLIAAGDGPADYVAKLKRLATQLTVADRVRWPGFVQGEAKEAFFGEVDALLMPSKFECFGMSAMEAIARGVPVIVSPGVGAAPVVTEFDCGLVAAPEQDAIAAAVLRTVADRRSWAQHSRHAVRAAQTRLSFAAHGAAQRACYESVLQQHQPEAKRPLEQNP